MNLEEYKIDPSDFGGNDVKALPDIPASAGMSSSDLKARFDNVSENIITPKFNNLIDGLEEAFDGQIIEVTLDKDFWGIGSGYYKNAFTVDNMTEDSILVPLYNEGNVQTLGANNVTGTYYENRGDKFIALFTGNKPTTDFTFLARLFN